MGVMHAVPVDTTKARLLLISPDTALAHQARAVTEAHGARLDVLPDVEAALAWLLNAENMCTHLLAPASLSPQDVTALAAMVDELTNLPTPLLLLGAVAGQGPHVLPVEAGIESAIDHILRDFQPFVPKALPDLTAETLRAALEAGQLRMRFQPVLHAETLAPAGLEMLARLHHPELGILRPKDFLPQAIASGQERVLTSLAAACALLELQPILASLMRELDGSLALNVPISAFCNTGAVERASALCAAAGLPRERLVIELLETPDLPDLRAVGAALERWRAAGFYVTLDDAGPPLPHWRKMLELPFTGIKLDASLAADAQAAKAEAAAIAEEAHRRGIYIVAEGIQDAGALARARALGVQAVQGFLFSRPLPAAAVPIWLRLWRARTPLQ